MAPDRAIAVLIVEDERLVALDLQELLVEAGYEVCGTAASAEEAIASASLRCPDVVLMDIRIAGQRDGIETAKLLKERFDLAVVYLTAHTDPATLARVTASEAYGYLTKPVRLPELRSAIEIAAYRQRFERRLRRSERWFSTTLHSIGDAVIAVDITGRVTFMNPAAELLIGRSAEEATGRSAREVLRFARPSAAAESETPIDAALRTNTIVHTRQAKIVNARTGAESVIDDSAAPVVDEGETLGVVMVFRDVTEQTRLQQQVELADRLASLGTLAAGVAHEVNNPLAVVVGNAFLLRAELAKVEAELGRARAAASIEMVNDIADAAERIGRIVADLSTFSRPTRRDVSGVTQLRPCIDWAIRTTAHELRQRALLVTELGPVPAVRADDARLGQVLINLLTNAAQAIAPGDAEHNRVTIVSRTDARGWAVIEVRDTGSGISPDVQKRIFEPFFTTKPQGQGTGLGLSICRGIVSSLGGELSLESQPGVGTCFRLALPPASAPEQPVPTSLAAPLIERSARILVIDDEPAVRNLLSRALHPHSVTCVDDAESGLRAIEAGGSFELILCDLMMPTATGKTFYERLLHLSPELAKRVVFMSGGAMTSELDVFLRAVPNHIVLKPFDIERLQRLVSTLLAATNSDARGHGS